MRVPIRFAVVLLLAGGCVSSSRHAEFAERFSSSSPYPALRREIESLLPDSLFPPSNAALKIVSLRTGETLYELNARLLFTPGSNQKLLTSAAALHILGPAYPLSTVFGIDTASGTIVVKGFGDPLLTTRDIDSAAGVLTGLLPEGKQWIVIGDVSYFDDQYWGKGWMWDDEPDPTAMFISPLSVNGNAIRVFVRPGDREGDSLRVATDPATDFVTFENEGATVADSVAEELEVTRAWRERSNIVRVTGQMRSGDSTTVRTISVWQPEGYLVSLLAERLRARGVAVPGTSIVPAATGAPEVFRLSHRVDSVVTFMNRVSDNLSAENLLHVLGAERGGAPGSAAAGLSAIRSFLGGKGIDTTLMTIADGSGVSRYNLLSADALVGLLAAMRSDSARFETFYGSLALAGADGSLSQRMRGTAAGGNLRAKTGTLSGACSLSGYVRTADGELLAFAMLMQHFARPVRVYRDVQDRIGALLGSLSRKKFSR